MRFATWQLPDGSTRAGVVSGPSAYGFRDGESVLDVVALGLDDALALGERTLGTSRATALTSVRLLPPLTPPSMRDFAAFEEHVLGALRSVTSRVEVPPEWYEAPAFYFTNPHALVGAHDDVPIPPGCEVFDFELEVAAIIGGRGASVSPEAAVDLVFGYTILNDWSARDVQAREMVVGLGPTKAKDSATTLGPWLVTRDEVDDRLDEDGFLTLECTVSVNGEMVGSDLLSNMAWTFPELVSHASRGTVVVAGDVLGSGTCGNGGCLSELWGLRGERSPRPLAPDDVVEMTVEKLGTIRNRVVAGAPVPPVGPARRRSNPLPRTRSDLERRR
ncbi:fumarylacetoacetate hydrolase family protein [Aeromicrobium endophyticum]|uniref:Fumarylacetoacetate hydrolase family protein n=1 Tax=Aeromicrobium endophyticum TaxID=2292704 RepID=A0A371P2M6_9ACTN|nr:fumarylacetoacetate hydrolase family protein [Aeromicrobium endophyticum]REK70202.1 fumarylacetoacetate hydrolase family protein [Aeromicrobium endophyticum]